MGDIVIEETNHRAFAMTMANFFMLSASIAVNIYGRIKSHKIYTIMGLLTAVVFFVGFIVAIIQASKTKKLLTITLDGIIDCSSIGGYGFISYNNIMDFEIVSQHGIKTIAITLKNPKEFMSKLAPAKRRQIKRNIQLNQPPIVIHTELAKDMEPEDILTLLQKRLSDYKRLYE